MMDPSKLQKVLSQQQASAKAKEAQEIEQASAAGRTHLQTDVAAGQEFGQQILGTEGLGRLGTDPTMQGIQDRLGKLSQGLTSQEVTAQKEQALGSIDANTQAQQRALQAQLARAGVKGGAAGAQLGQVATSGIQAKAGLEQDMILKQREAEISGIKDLAAFSRSTQEFDLGQAAAEKNILLQSGLGFANFGAAERGAVAAAQAAEKARIAQAAACHTGDVEVKMKDGSFKLISQIDVGEEVYGGGLVKIIGKAFADSDIYVYEGEKCSATHLIAHEGAFTLVSKIPGAFKTTMSENTIVYPMLTEKGFYITRANVVHGDVYTEDNSSTASIFKSRIF